MPPVTDPSGQISIDARIAVRGLQWKFPCIAATTANITIATALNSGDTIDGVTLADGDHVLVKDQSTASQNGIYIVGATPIRSWDLDQDATSDVPIDEVRGAAVYIIAGTVNGGKVFFNTNTSAVVIGTNNMTWAQFSAAGGITVQDEGSPLTTAATTLDFTGAGVTASGSGTTKTVNIPGGGTPDLSTLTLERSIQAISDYVAGYDLSATATRGFPVGALRGGPQHSVIFDDCWYRANNASPSAYDGGVHENFANSGTASTTTPLVNHPGVIALGTVTSTSSRSALLQVNPGDAIILAGGKARFGVVANLPTLSDGTNTFICRMGLGALNAGDNDGIYFRYGSALNGGEWQGVCRSGGSEAGSVLDTNTAADTSWHRYEFEVNAAATSVEFFIDGTSKGTVSSNIVTAATRLAPASIVRSAGTASRSFLIDAYWLHLEFTTAR